MHLSATAGRVHHGWCMAQDSDQYLHLVLGCVSFVLKSSQCYVQFPQFFHWDPDFLVHRVQVNTKEVNDVAGAYCFLWDHREAQAQVNSVL